MNNVSIICLQFFGSSKSSQSLCAILSNGSILALNELDIPKLGQLTEGQLQLIPQFLKQAKLSTWKFLESHQVLKASVVPSREKDIFHVFTVNEFSRLIVYELPFSSDSSVKELLAIPVKSSLVTEKIQDLRVIGQNHETIIIALTKSRKLVVTKLTSGEDQFEEIASSELSMNQFHNSHILALNLLDEKCLLFQLLIRSESSDGGVIDSLFSVSLQDELVWIIPHGTEENVLQIVPFYPSTFVQTCSTAPFCLFGMNNAELLFYCFSGISKTIVSKCFEASLNSNLELNKVKEADLSFDQALGHLLYYLSSLMNKKAQFIEDEFKLVYNDICLKRKFSSEIVLFLGLLLDSCWNYLSSDSLFGDILYKTKVNSYFLFIYFLRILSLFFRTGSVSQ
jgi:hypothetical protein